MQQPSIEAKIGSDSTPITVVRKYGVGGRDYIVKSIFTGDTDIKAALLKLAEQKAIREMGLDIAIP